MAPDGRTLPLRNGREVSPTSPSNALAVGCSDRPTTLENALKAFQDVLDVDERKRLREEMSVSCDASQVISFTARLDIVDPNRRGRSIATRLHSILETVQRFSEVVSIYVSSHPEIAALVWGSVRLAFTTFSDLLNGFDTLAPQFKEYQVLFPDSLALRNAVYDFHSAIISCCTQVISSTRRTWSQQAWASLTSSFESEIRPRVAEIHEKAKVVKGQAALAKAQDDSRRQASLAAELQFREKQRKWNSLLLKLSSYDHGSEFNHARGKIHRGTAEWIFSTSDFQDWYESADSRVLIISGKIGSGKTILTANVVSYILQKLSPNSSVSYLFIRFDDEDSRSSDLILRSLIFQTLAVHEVDDVLMELLEKSISNRFDRDSLLALLDRSISFFNKSFLVVDGLDQCSLQEQHSLLQLLFRIKHMSNTQGGVKILISVRESMVKEVDRELAPTEHLRIGLADTNADLARYAEEILAERRDTGQLVIGNEAIMDQIVEKLRAGGESMFLWVFLTIEDICSCPTDHDIRQTLEVLPRKLSATFARALERILSSQSHSIADLVQRTFKWVATVRRPMTRWELGEALGVKILQKSAIKDQTINGTERIPGWCENLVQIQAGDESIRFFHHSIKTYLQDTKLKSTQLEVFHVDLKAWDHQVGEVCVTYLSFSDFARALTVFSSETKNALVRQIAMSNEGRSIPAAVGGSQPVLDALPETGRHTAARFLRRFFKTKSPGGGYHVPKGVSKPAESQLGDSLDLSELFAGYPFFLYATNFWVHHTFNFRPSVSMTWSLWKSQVDKSIFEDGKLWANFGQQPPGFEIFDTQLANTDASILDVSRTKKFNDEQVMLHKAIVFADFIAHRALLTYVLATIKDRGHNLTPKLIEQLLPTRRVFQFPREREGYLREEQSHDGLVSLVTEFVACAGPTDIWPRHSSSPEHAFCTDQGCIGKPIHDEIVDILFGSGYSRESQPWLHLFAKILVLKFAKETSDAIEAYINSKKPCIHEIQTLDNRDIIDTILATDEHSSFRFARWVLDLHENCAGGHRYSFDDWRRKLQAALRNNELKSIELYLQQSEMALKEEKRRFIFDYDLLHAVNNRKSLSPDLRSRAISISIPGASMKGQGTAYEEFDKAIIADDWDVAVALSRHGLKLVTTVSRAGGARAWFQLLDDVLCCVSQSATPRCTQRWVPNKPTLELCVPHAAEARQVWGKSFPAEEDHDWEIFDSLYKLAYPAATEGPQIL